MLVFLCVRPIIKLDNKSDKHFQRFSFKFQDVLIELYCTTNLNTFFDSFHEQEIREG